LSLFQKSRALVKLIRPELPAAAGVCVVLGQAMALGKMPPPGLLLLGFPLGFFLSSSAMIFNDYFDLEVDRINAPFRPLPAGLLSPNEAVAAGILSGLVALSLAWVISPLVFLLSLALWTLGYLYNWKLKAAGLWGNLSVSTNVASTFIIGGISAGQAASPLVWIFGLIAFCFDLAEEIAGDAMDMEGDVKRGSRSLAIRYGRAAALRISALLFGGMVLLTLLPLRWGETGPGYWVPVGIMDAILLVFPARLLRSRTSQEGVRAMRVMYISASLGLLAFLLARF
jgi:geranylgeranylglycerol-phosphate geranylgeranyltransferase